MIREVICVAAKQEEEFYETLNKYNFVRITSWVFRFITNCKNKEKLSDPLDTA